MNFIFFKKYLNNPDADLRAGIHKKKLLRPFRGKGKFRISVFNFMNLNERKYIHVYKC